MSEQQDKSTKREVELLATAGRTASVISALLVGLLLLVARETYGDFKTLIAGMNQLSKQMAETNMLLGMTATSTETAHARLMVLMQEIRLLDNRITAIEAKTK